MAKGQRIGYVRVSTVDQNTARQLDGIQVDRIFEDRCSGKNTDRPKLVEMQQYLRDGDTLIAHSMDRLARNVSDLREIVFGLTKRGVKVEFVKEALTFGDEKNSMADFMLNVMGAFAEFERALILERQKEGIAKAKAAGVYKGRKPKLASGKVKELIQRAAAGESKTDLAREFGIDRSTLYVYLGKHK